MFQDAEVLVVDFFRLVVGPDVRVGTFVPNPRPAWFVRSWRTGGAAENRALDVPLITTEVWGSENEATPDISQEASRLRDALFGRSSLIPPARRIEEVTGLHWDPDPVSGAPRYSFTSRLWLRAKF